MEQKFDTYQMVTDRICELLETGLRPWAMPWVSITGTGASQTAAWSGNDGHQYSLLNQMLLLDPKKKYTSLEEMMTDVSGEWVTFKQALARGGSVRKGEHGRKVIWFSMIEKETGDIDDDGNPIKKRFPVLKVYTVFHIRQCDGLVQKYHTDPATPMAPVPKDEQAEAVSSAYLTREGIKLIHGGNRAFYRPSTDSITLPERDQFISANEYYSTLFHEETHSTGHESRLNRLSKTAAFGNEEYSQEELVAEIGAASIMATLGLETDNTLTNSAAYIKGWLKALRNDKKLIVVASARAEKAIRMILNIKDC